MNLRGEQTDDRWVMLSEWFLEEPSGERMGIGRE